LGLEKEPSPGDGSNDLLRIVSERLSDVGDALRDRFVRDRDIPPYSLQELLAGDQAAGALYEIPQHLKGFWAEFDLARAAQQAACGHIERTVEEQVR